MVEINGVRILFTGDANGKKRRDSPDEPKYVEKQLLDLEREYPGILRADILKVPHHGSETASTSDFIKAVAPRFVIISASSIHDLPKDSVITRYKSNGYNILNTNEHEDRNTDHIICTQNENAELICDFSANLNS